MHVRGNVDEFFDELDRRELLRNRGPANRDAVFLSYSHNDRDRQWVERVRVHLKATFYDQNLNIWDDTRIPSGARWHEEIKTALAGTKVAVLIISADYLASDYIRTHELPSFLLAAESEGAVIMALIGSSCSLTGGASSLQDIQFVNPLDRPLDGIPPDEQERYFNKLARDIYSRFQA